MRDIAMRVGREEYLRLTPNEQDSLGAWVKSSFDCDPNLLEYVEFPAATHHINRAMELGIYIREDPARPTLLAERHTTKIAVVLPDDLLRRLADLCGVALDSRECDLCDTTFQGIEDRGHIKVEAVDFPDGCDFSNYRCTATGRWGWNRHEIENPHGHDLPAAWVR